MFIQRMDVFAEGSISRMKLDQGFLEVTVVDAKSKEAQAMIGRAIEEALRQDPQKEILKIRSCSMENPCLPKTYAEKKMN